jgi:REP-associated tyrosine transposase
MPRAGLLSAHASRAPFIASGRLFHVYCRGVAASVAFPSDDDRTELFRLLGRCERRYRWELHAACVLSTHYHLVLVARVTGLSKGVHQLNWRYARYFNRRYGQFGHVFAERFQTRALEGEDRVFDTCAYVLLNPVKAKTLRAGGGVAVVIQPLRPDGHLAR